MYIDFITVEITDKCNAKCPQCMRTNPVGCTTNVFVKNKDITLNDFKKYVPYKILQQLKTISFNCPMGDPVAHNNIFPILDYIVEINPSIKIDFPTNGSLRNKDYWQRLGSYKQIQVTFAIDGVTQEIHELYRRNTNLDKILKNAKDFISAGGNAVWQFIIFAHNSDQESIAERISKDLGFSRFKSFNSTRFNQERQFKYTYNKKNYVLEMYEQEIKFRSDTHFAQHNNTNSIDCKSLRNNEIFIDLSGNIMPCCYHAGSLFASQNISNQGSFNNYIDVSFEKYDTKKFNINEENFLTAFQAYRDYMNDLKKQWRVLNPPMCKNVCGKCN